VVGAFFLIFGRRSDNSCIAYAKTLGKKIVKEFVRKKDKKQKDPPQCLVACRLFIKTSKISE
jgi:hypothetical protein